MKIIIWRDRVQKRHGLPILWVILAEHGLVKETLNATDPHTDGAEAVLFAGREAKRRGITWDPIPKDV